MPRRDIIVMGASAGGIGVLQTILPALPWDLQASIFVVVHTTEDSPGVLPEILNRYSRLPVLYAVHNAPILPARIYVAPAGQRHMRIDRGKVVLETGPRENRNRPSIDALFRSAALAYGPRTVGVILSGTLDDGTAGLRWIKRGGGVALVQDPDEALFRGMPASAIANVDVDRVLRAEDIAAGIVDAVNRAADDDLPND